MNEWLGSVNEMINVLRQETVRSTHVSTETKTNINNPARQNVDIVP